MALSSNVILPTNVGSGAGLVGTQLFQQGMSGLDKAINSYRDRTRNTAINKLMSIAPIDGQSPLAYQQQQRSAMSAIDGINPLEALQLSNAQANPYVVEQKRLSDLEQLGLNNQFRTDTLDESIRHNQAVESKVTPKGYGSVTTDNGDVYSFNKDTGTMELVQKGNGFNSKNISLQAVTSRDSSGVETTQYVPFNKVTGKPIGGGDVPTGTKYPTISTGDKSYRDDIPAIDTNIANLEAMINNPAYASSFGIADNAIDGVSRWAGIESDGASKNAEISALSSNLLAGFGKAQMNGVLTDQDMKIIKQQIPSASDSPQTAKKKMAFVKELMATRNKAWSNRLKQSNPGWLEEDNVPVTSTTPKVPLEDLVPLGDGLYKMPDGTVIRKKAK